MEFRNVRGLKSDLPESAVAAAGVHIAPYDIRGVAPGTHLGLPSPTVTLIVDLRDGLVLTGPGLNRQTSFTCGIGELHVEAYTVHHDGNQVGVQLDLTPGAVRRLFGVPVGSLSSMQELDQVDAALTSRLRDTLGDLPHAVRRQAASAIIADQLIERDAARSADPDAVRTWQAILRSRGRVRVSSLVEESGWSARKLTGVFAAEFGMGPKQAARLVRFDEARRLLEAGCAPAHVAADLGYADQAHLSREFASFTGRAPTRFLADRRADGLTDAAHLDDARSPREGSERVLGERMSAK
ncbi:helix-turn-helix domain-containing protein [Gordonia sp. (in: high G+C Gram-positive bacteria)]|uniref:helix-turn-helix domain-containing protein n=1 Tax=Gordonia sp. (in: high G+C Gram-positive bacteria) TaxID=84139 RepID=UPI003F977BFE